jgi:hypothetical protein
MESKGAITTTEAKSHWILADKRGFGDDINQTKWVVWSQDTNLMASRHLPTQLVANMNLPY